MAFPNFPSRSFPVQTIAIAVSTSLFDQFRHIWRCRRYNWYVQAFPTFPLFTLICSPNA